ncbi:MAG TPA: AI-2E family transporter [Spirochaetota bacterium]|nr:AI-2E family transporter [Spirochaetota bacterium]
MKKYRLRDTFFIIFLIAVTIGFFRVIAPYIISLCIAFILTDIFSRPYNWFIKKKINNKIAAGLTVGLIVLVIVIPLTLGSLILIRQVNNVFVNNWASMKKSVTSVVNVILNHLPELNMTSETNGVREIASRIVSTFDKFIGFFVSLVQQAFLSISKMLFHFVIILYIIYFLLFQGKQFIRKVQYTVPLNNNDESELLKGLSRIVDATIIGTMFIGVMEGIYGSIIFAVVGIKGFMIWGLLMAVFSMIPVIGTNTILVPTAIGMLILGNYWEAVVIIAAGSSGILLSQNVIKPKLVGDRSGLHPAIIVVSTLGGIAWLGLIGFLIGPLIASLFVLTWEQFTKRYQQELIDSNG